MIHIDLASFHEHLIISRYRCSMIVEHEVTKNQEIFNMYKRDRLLPSYCDCRTDREPAFFAIDLNINRFSMIDDVKRNK